MNNLKRLVVTLSLMSVLAVTAFAGDISTPPCAPGEINTPPCSGAPQSATDESVTPGEVSAPPASTTADVVTVAELVHWALALI